MERTLFSSLLGSLGIPNFKIFCCSDRKIGNLLCQHEIQNSELLRIILKVFIEIFLNVPISSLVNPPPPKIKLSTYISIIIGIQSDSLEHSNQFSV